MKVLDDWVAIVDTKDNAKNILQAMKDIFKEREMLYDTSN